MSQHAFGGSIPEHYQRYLVPLILDEYARDLAAGAKAPAGGAALETACGTGLLTRYLRRTLPPSVRLVATDVNEAMLAVARREETPGVEYSQADATSLPFADDSFDLVACQFGVMFFPDRARGYAEAARVLRPGGRLRFNVWESLERNPLPRRTHEIVTAMFPEDPPGFLAVPWGYHDVGLIETELRQAGFEDIRIVRAPARSRAPSARDVAMAFGAGSPLALQLAERGDPAKIVDEMARALRAEFGEGAIDEPMEAIVIDARVG